MSTKHEIILIDGGDDVGRGSSSSPESMPSRPVSPGGGSSYRPDSGGGGSRRSREKEPEDATSAAWGLASAISKALGGIGLVDTAVRLKKAFEDIYAAVTKLEGRLDETGQKEAAGTSVDSSGSTSKPARKRSAEPEDDFIEGEFAYSRPSGSAGEKVTERGLSVPSGEAADAVGAMTRRTAGAGEIGAARTVIAGGEIEGGGAAAGAIAGGEIEGTAAAAGAAEGLAGVAAAAGPLAIAIGGITVAAVAGAIALKALFDTLSNEVKRLENVSADVNVATSMTEVRREMADLRRADEIGPDLARFENVRSKMEDKMADLWTQVLKVLLNIFEVIEPGVKVVTGGIEIGATQLEVMNANIDALKAAFTIDRQDDAVAFAAQAKAMARAAAAMERFVNGQEDEEDLEDPFLKGFLDQFGAGGAI